MMEHVLMWDESKVTKWISSIGYPSFEKQFKEQGITGDVLVNLDHESLRDLSVLTVGQRMDLLKNIYQLKIHYRVPITEWDYTPPSLLYETDWLGQNGMADYRKIEAAFQERDARIIKLTEDLGRVNSDINTLKEELGQLKNKKLSSTEYSTKLHNSGSIRSNHSKQPLSGNSSNMSEESRLTPNVLMDDGGAIKVLSEELPKNSEEASKNIRLSNEDPTPKVIQSALAKYRVRDELEQYALWIQFGPEDEREERVLRSDEMPLKISKQLKKTNQNPIFILKHIKDNKPFIPPQQRPATPKNQQQPQKQQQSNTMTNTSIIAQTTKSALSPDNASTGKVGFEPIAPVMSSSISSPTTTTTNSAHTSTISLDSSKMQQYNNELGLDNAVVNAIFSINNSPNP